MFEHRIHHPGIRAWERSNQWYLDSQNQDEFSQYIFSTCDGILDNTPMYDDAGEDHVVFIRRLGNFGLFAIKQVKDSSREMLVYGAGIKPEEVREAKESGMRASMSSIDCEKVADYMRRSHEIITTGIREYSFLPTAILVHRNQIFRIQRFIESEKPHRDPLILHLTMQFYNHLKQAWPSVEHSDQFYALPTQVRQYYSYFGIDDGLFTNALFRGFIGTHADFVIIDY